MEDDDLKLLTYLYRTEDRLYHTLEMLAEGTGLEPEAIQARMARMERSGEVQALSMGPHVIRPLEYLLSYRGRTAVKRALGESRQ
jgi:hypothetical protein